MYRKISCDIATERNDTMPTRKKHPRLPNGYGSIRFLGKRRRNAYAVHPPADIDGNRPPALCYVDDWMKGFIILTAYKAGTYVPGMEADLDLPEASGSGSTGSLEALANKILADYSRIKGVEPPQPEKSFAEVYQAFFDDKYKKGHNYSKSSITSTRTAFKNCSSLHDKLFRDLRAKDLQSVLDSCPLKHASLELILNLYHQMYHYAEGQEWCDKRYDQFVSINQPDDDEHGVPFTDDELRILWSHKDDPTIELLLILCYSGWRITEILSLQVDLDNRYFLGGIKTAAGKGRIVPIHSSIFPAVQHRMNEYGCLLPCTKTKYRNSLYESLESIGLAGTPKHTPHDARHTFSRLCEKYGVQENDRKRMLGHSFQDVTNKVYGHRSLEDLRIEIEKIKTDL